MATYIQGLTDYIPQIQPFQPDLNFYGNVMQTRQTRYDAAKKKISELYGSLLYAPLTGDNNIKRRDEFFKFIDNDIKRISGMDLSLQQNQDAAMEIFSGFYNDKDMVNDMVWTRNYNLAVQKHEAMKSCFDPAKCGGQAWDDGYMELQYKREDFKNATDAERLNFEMPTYTPYYNWQSDAIKAAKDKGYKVTKDELHGDYKVTKQNGELLAGGLRSVFQEVYGADPRVEANYKTKSFVTRKTTVHNNIDKYGTLEASNIAYLNETINAGLKSLNKDLDKYTAEYDSTSKRIVQLQNDIDAKGGTPEELKTLEEAIAARDQLLSTKEYLQNTISSIQANAESGNIGVLERRADMSKAQMLLKHDLHLLADNIAYTQDVQLQTISEAPYVAIKKNLEADLVRKKWDYKYKVEEMGLKHQYDKELEEFKAELAGTKKSTKGPSFSLEDYSYQEAVAGGISELNVKDHPALAYALNMDEWRSLEGKAQGEAARFNYSAFEKAKGAGDIEYLNTVYGKGKWEKVNDPSSYGEMVANSKLNSGILFNRTMNYFKTKTSNVGWGEKMMLNNSKTITDIQQAQAAADGTLKYMINSMNKVADEAKKQVAVDPRYRYVDYMFHPGSKGVRGQFFLNNEQAPFKFKEVYKKENYGATDADAERVYKFLHDDIFGRYNSELNKDASIHTGIGLGGEGNIQGIQISRNGIDPSDRGVHTTNMYTRDFLSKIKNDAGSSFVGLGGNTKEVFDNAVSNAKKGDKLRAIATEFIKTIDASGDIAGKDEKKQFYDINAGLIGGENKDMAYVSIKLPYDYIEKRTGKDKMLTPEEAMDLYYNPITIFYDKNKIKSKFVEKATDTSLQRNLATNGFTDINTYSNISTVGPVSIKYNKQEDLVTYGVTFKVRQLDGTWKTGYKEYRPTSLAEAPSQYDNIIAELEKTKGYNLKVMNEERNLNKNKK